MKNPKQARPVLADCVQHAFIGSALICVLTVGSVHAQPPGGGGSGGGGSPTTLSSLGCGPGEIARVNAADEWECSPDLTTTEDRVTTLESQNLDARIGTLEGQNLNDRLTTIEDQDLNGRVGILEGQQGNHEERLSDVEAQSNDNSQRISDLESGAQPPVTDIAVDCALGDTISGALGQATPGHPITVTVIGTCAEDPVSVGRDDVTIQGSSLDGTGEPVDTLVGRFIVSNAHRVTIRDLVVRDSSGAGITLDRGAIVDLVNLDVTGHAGEGIFVFNHSAAFIDGVNSIVSPTGGFAAVYAVENSMVRITNSVLRSERSEFFDGVGLAVYRNSHARLDNNNVIENTTVSADWHFAHALEIVHGSTLAIRPNGNQVIGNVYFGKSTGDFRNTSIGEITALSESSLRLAGGSYPGDIRLELMSIVKADGGPGDYPSAGTIMCADSTSGVDFGTPFTVVGCTVMNRI